MANQERFSESRPQHTMSSQLAKDKHYMIDSGKDLHESSRTDSGFLSGANLTSDQNLSCDDLSTPISQKSAPEFSRTMRSTTDSGFLDEQFSSLSLQSKEHNSYNDLSYSGSSSNRTKPIVEEQPPTPVQPWELYFQQDEDGDTQLHIAIIQGYVEVAMSLIRLAPHPTLLDLRNKVCQTALHLAVLTHQTAVVRRLVVFGADVGRADRNGNTPLHLACMAGYLDCVHSLTVPVAAAEMSSAAAAARPNAAQRQRRLDLNETNYEGEMCVHLAAKAGHIDVLKHLTWFGADINAREYKSGRTVLHYAVENMDEELLSFLLDEAGSGLVVDTPTYAGHSAYMLAAALKSKAAQALLDHGAAPVLMEEDDDDHPDHNAIDDDDDDDDEMIQVDIVRSSLGAYLGNAVLVQ